MRGRLLPRVTTGCFEKVAFYKRADTFLTVRRLIISEAK